MQFNLFPIKTAEVGNKLLDAFSSELLTLIFIKRVVVFAIRSPNHYTPGVAFKRNMETWGKHHHKGRRAIFFPEGKKGQRGRSAKGVSP
jgi:hypothetical protein